MIRALLPILLLSGCSIGSWGLNATGGDFLDSNTERTELDDACSVDIDRFLVLVDRRELLDLDGVEVDSLRDSEVFDMTSPGVNLMAYIGVPSGEYGGIHLRIAPEPGATIGHAFPEELELITSEGASVIAGGTITCGDSVATFAWSFAETQDVTCEGFDPIEVVRDEHTLELLTIHGEYLFADRLDAGGSLRAQAIVDADADHDGEVTRAELASAPVSADYDVGGATPGSLDAFLAHQSTRLMDVDGFTCTPSEPAAPPTP